MRDVARPISAKAGPSLFHDELGEIFEPQAFADVVAAAATHGLRFLNEAEPGRMEDGMPQAEMDDAALIRAIQADDYASVCFFRQSLFVRDDRAPVRRPDIAAVADLYASAQCKRTGPTSFESAVAKLAAAWPRGRRVGDLVRDEMRLEAVYRLHVGKAVALHATALPGVAEPGSHPQASALARVLLAMGEDRLFTLDHRAVLLDDPAPRAFLSLLDGSRDWAAIEADWARSGHADGTAAAAALARLAAVPLLVA